ncbi:hypothetical protein RRG08_060549 [Elysia crispata]|uniref:Phospholipase B1, membrane-associated n=1 Tax=Elysia crispata TaxID=231223 RepID=A0AAE1E169_9GAST|nr:hypothetical protein RRG08_060549 [Elysia crispata]
MDPTVGFHSKCTQKDFETSSTELVHGEPLTVRGEFIASPVINIQKITPLTTSHHGNMSPIVSPNLKDAHLVFIPLLEPFQIPTRVFLVVLHQALGSAIMLCALRMKAAFLTAVVSVISLLQKKRTVHRYPIPNFACHTQLLCQGREPSSIHYLHPADVDVVAALGDSLTAGNGVDATSILGVLTENRGLSWSGGGDGSLDEGVLTFPNIIKKYNPQVVGYSVGSGKNTDVSSGLNVADPGDTSFEMSLQAQMLVDRMKTTTGFQNDWKVITIFIGRNDLCDACNDWARYSPANYRKNLQDALDIFHAKLPRTLVNLVLIFDITLIAQLGKTDF